MQSWGDTCELSRPVEAGGGCPIFITAQTVVECLSGLSRGCGEMLLIKETRRETGVGGAGDRIERTCVSACNSYLQFKCPPGPISMYWMCGALLCVSICVCMCVGGISRSADRALPNGRPDLNIKAQTGCGISTIVSVSVRESWTGLYTFWMHADKKSSQICAE